LEYNDFNLLPYTREASQIFLQYIHSIDIDYLSTLSRNDLLNLSQTTQYLNNVINQLHHSIPNFKMSSKINIANALYELHVKVVDIVNDNYTSLPI